MSIEALSTETQAAACRLTNKQPHELLEVWMHGGNLFVVLVTGEQHCFNPEQVTEQLGADVYELVSEELDQAAAPALERSEGPHLALGAGTMISPSKIRPKGKRT